MKPLIHVIRFVFTGMALLAAMPRVARAQTTENGYWDYYWEVHADGSAVIRQRWVPASQPSETSAGGATSRPAQLDGGTGAPSSPHPQPQDRKAVQRSKKLTAARDRAKELLEQSRDRFTSQLMDRYNLLATEDDFDAANSAIDAAQGLDPDDWKQRTAKDGARGEGKDAVTDQNGIFYRNGYADRDDVGADQFGTLLGHEGLHKVFQNAVANREWGPGESKPTWKQEEEFVNRFISSAGRRR